MLETLRTLWGDESGIATVEYALLLTVIVVGTVAAWGRFGARLTDLIDGASEEFASLPPFDQ